MSERVNDRDGQQANALWLLRALRRSALVATALVLAGFGLFAWDYLNERAEALAEKNAALVESYVLRLVQTQDVMLAAADEALGRFAPDGTYTREAHVFLRDIARRIDGSLGIAFVRSDGRFLVSSMVHPATGAVGERAYLRETPRDGLFIERLRITPDDREALVVTRRSAQPGADEGGVWASATQIEVLTEFLRRIAARPGDTASVLREDGTLIARNVPMTEPIVLDASQPVMRQIAAAGGGIYRADAVTDGQRRIYATARVGTLPLYASFGISTASIWFDWALAMAAAAAVLGTVAASAYLMARYAERSLLAEAAQRELAFDRRLLREAEKTAAVKETMLRELNHRVKNSLQMIQALIRLQRDRPAGPDLDEIGARVAAIATIHDLLYQSAGDFEVDLGELLRRIAESPAVVAPETGLRLVVEAESIVVDASSATPLALCAVELVTNAVKHAYGPEGGEITVRLAAVGSDQARLVIEDRGRGLSLAGGRRSGIRVVEELVRQLDGTLSLSVDGGTRFEIAFPVTSAEDRIAANLAAS